MDEQPTPPTDEQEPPPQPETAATKEKGDSDPEDDLNKKIEKELSERLKSSKSRRKDFASEWKHNIEARMGQAPAHAAGGMMSGGQYVGTIEDSDELRSTINPDWSLTKMKTANLFSQVPTVQGTHENTQYAMAVPPFVKALNYELSEKRTNIAVPMEEVLNDVVNASGVGAIYVDYQARFRDKRVPKLDPQTLPSMSPEQLDQLMEQGVIPSEVVPQMVDYRFGATRISPRDILWSSEFTGSNFDDSDFIGYTGRMPISDAKHELKLDDEELKKLAEEGSEGASGEEDLRMSPSKDERLSIKRVKYDHLFYWRHRFDPEELCFSCIWEVIFASGKETPVLHRPWKGQKKDEQTGKYLGAQKFPVRLLTLTYITDNPIPPSDTSAGRPQVNDLRLSRTQTMQNRARSVPIRYYDTNRVDPLIADNLMRGVVQGFIPLQGRGDGAIGEIARASYPKEDFEFDQITKSDLMEVWQFGAGSGGGQTQHRQTKAEAQNNASQFQTRIGQEKNRVAQFFLSVCEVLAGYMALYSDFPNLTDQEKQQMLQVWDSKRVLHDLVLKILPDSQIVLDAGQKIERIFKILNMVGKSGFVNPAPLIAEILELGGIDPMAPTPWGTVLIKPQPKAPEEPTIGFRFGSEDLQNPLVVALLLQLGKAPSPEMLEEAKRLLMQNQLPAQPKAPPQGPPGQPPPPQQKAQKVPAAPDVVFEEAPEHAPPPTPGVAGAAEAHPDWQLTSKIAKRGARDMNS